MMEWIIYLPVTPQQAVTIICVCLFGLWLAWMDDKYNEGWKEYARIRKELEKKDDKKKMEEGA